MTPRRCGPLAYVPINRRPALAWPSGARVALWVNPNVEFFGLDDVMPSNLNDRVPRDQAKIPNMRNWALRDYGNRIGIWRLMEVLSRHGIRASAALNSEVCDHHPEIIEEGGKLGWEWIGHNQTNAMRLTEMDPAGERAAIRTTIDRIRHAPGRLARRRSGGDLEHARLSRGSRNPLCLRLGQRRPALPVRDWYAAAGVTAVFGTDQRRPGLF
jgi:peptidoglycan/xylan/chitin deacetylase (PgdA/CDA1 family)